jgi:hypothetical protein
LTLNFAEAPREFGSFWAMLELGQIIPSSEQQTPQALAIYHKSEIEKWWAHHQGHEH